ncbi:amino acid ABC transporter permease [Roseiarcus sp.]|uniref:amino acid ABC transporter permease n=1 Tax=Roseiarcus sp. TaxID=1969460 RepID=UPI003D0CCB70
MDPARGAKLSTWLNDQRVRGRIYQTLLLACVAALACGAIYNAVTNMQARGMPMGFGFWNEVAGFDINLHLISYTNLSTYGRAFWVGLLNTLLIAVICIPLATLLGFAIGVTRLSPNWLLSRLALVYTSILRNIPLLLLLLFWYNAVLKSLPGPRQAISIGDVVFLDNRGLYLPMPVPREQSVWFISAIAAALILAAGFREWARRRQERTGEQAPSTLVAVGLILGLPAIASAAGGAPFGFDIAKLSGFNLKGGLQVIPEMAALVFGLVTFTAAFIAEIVRAGLLAVPVGQSEAAAALGLHRGLTMKLVVVPQAMRLITPPLTSQYLNIVKNSSLAVFIGYPDLVQIFAGTVLNQTQAAVQVMAITMAVYLFISLAVAVALNLFNARYALKER